MVDENVFNMIGTGALTDIGAIGSPPDSLFHYTGAAGLLGMVQCGRLWFGDAFFLNDGSELKYGLSMIEETLEGFVKGRSSALQDAGKAIFQHTFEASHFHRPGVFCMSARDNLLNQWRDYGRDTVCYSIGIDPRPLIMSNQHNLKCVLIRMQYKEMKQRSFVERVVEETLSKVEEVIDGRETYDGHADIVSAAALPLTQCVVALKHPDFEAEEEWRLASSVSTSIHSQKFRATPLGVAPYYEFKRLDEKPLLPLTRITVGPSPHGFAAQMGLNMLLQAHGYDGLPTDFSKVPLRY